MKEGNERYLREKLIRVSHISKTRRKRLKNGQSPFAVIVGCSDSRVPPEIVFDQAPGDLFVIRTAGNIVTTTQLGSIEFAVEQLNSRLIVVLGHSNCGAVTSTLDVLENPAAALSPHLNSIVEEIKSGVEKIWISEAHSDRNELVDKAVQANIQQSVNRIKNDSLLIRQKISDNQLLVIGAEYSLESGEVKFFE